MKLHGFKTVPISKIRAPGNIEAIKRDQHTIDIAESYDSTGGQAVEPIVIEFGTWRLLGGRHRFAAALLRKLKEVDVRMVEGTPEELETMELLEQLRRRRPTDAEVARLVEIQHPRPAETFPSIDDDDAPFDTETLAYNQGHQPVARGEKSKAIEAVAKATGKTEAAVKQAEHRARKDYSKKDAFEKPDSLSCLEDLGLKVPEEIEVDAQAEFAFLDDIDRAMIRLQAACSRHLVPYPQVKIALHDVAAYCRQSSPDSICPHCKLTKLRAKCLACGGRGWLTNAEMANIPQALLATGDKAGVFVNGKFTLLKDVK